MEVYYLCNRKACGENHDCKECRHTSKIEYAVNFRKSCNKKSGIYFEKCGEKETSCIGATETTGLTINDLP